MGYFDTMFHWPLENGEFSLLWVAVCWVGLDVMATVGLLQFIVCMRRFPDLK